ncbi:MAG: ATP-dependent helicase [Gallionella sp.]|nr:ATP-dependent helicase [Gallionella sp.]
MTGVAFTPTDEQRKVIRYAGSAFVSACPGAGKTRVLIERARALLQSDRTGRGVAFLSFTNAAVSELEMRLRQGALLPSPPFPHFIGTFDSFLWQFMIAPLGVPGCMVPPHLIPDKDDRTVRPFEKARDLPLGCFDRGSGEIIPAIAQRLNFDPAAKPAVTKAYVTAARNARERFLARGELDFADVRSIAKTHLQNPDLSSRLGAALAARFREVIVDEAQDCNPADLEIIEWLRTASIIMKVICDPHQSIYAFRGGVSEQLIAFGETFPANARLSMSGNFRSSDHICKAIVTLRAKDARTVVDQALGDYRTESTPIHILAYPGTSVPATIGTKFHELILALNVDVADCPVLAATKASGAKAIGQPIDSATQDSTLRLAMAVTAFHFASEMGNRKAALEEVHRVILEIEGRIGAQTYHQYLKEEDIGPDVWRPRILHFVRQLRYDPTLYANAEAWHARAKELIAPQLPAGGASINQRLPRNVKLATALAVPRSSIPTARTIHAVKGMEFPAVCVVMTARYAKGIIDYLVSGQPTIHAEDSREIYVAASRAQRLLVMAVPKSQANRLAAHLGSSGAQITLIAL